MSNYVKLSDNLLNQLVDALTYLPYRQVQDIFVLLSDEMAEQQESQDGTSETPQLIVRK